MKVILMHGMGADPDKKWYPWLFKKIKEKNIEMIIPTLPNSENPNLGDWINEIIKCVPDNDSVLIGHSRGGVAILRWLEQLSEGKKVKKVILVATNSGKEKSSEKGFFSREGYDFEQIKSHCDNFVVIHSKDDNWVPFSAGEENAKGLGAKFKIYTNKRHFGIKESPQIPEVLEEI